MVGVHPHYATALTDEEIIKEARDLLEELDAFDGMEFDSDAEVACQRSHGMISALVERLEIAKHTLTDAALKEASPK
ncbi:hypothetical protein GOA90_25345 [Sinorhizobium meliloti]|nr:hypothetical protein [Sinorhizobium meliloti]